MSVSVDPQTDPLEQIPVAEPVRPNEDTVVKILKRVRTRLEHHWTTGQLNDGEGNYWYIAELAVGGFKRLGVIEMLELNPAAAKVLN